MTDQTTDGIQNMNLQDYEGCEFDPFSPVQQAKMANIQSNGGTDLDLLGDSVDPGIANGHGKAVSFDPQMSAGAPAYPSEGQGYSRQKVQRNMSAGEILGYQNEYGESITGQLEYEGYSDEEYGEGSLVDYGQANNGPPVLPHPQSDQNYYMSTGQPLVDFGSNNVQPGGSGLGYPPMSDQFTKDTGKYSSEGYEEYEGDSLDQETGDMGEVQHPQQQSYMEDSCDNDEIEPSSWAPERDAERARRSLSPERSVSPRDMTSQSGADIISSPQYDTDSYADTGDISSPSEMYQHPNQSDPHSFIPASEIPGSPARALSSPQPSITESESSYADSKGSPRHKIPRPRTKKKKSIDLPPWDDNVVIPPLPRMKPTLIGKQDDVPPPSSPLRPRTAPSLFTRKDASSDSGVEDDKAAKSPRKPSKRKRKCRNCHETCDAHPAGDDTCLEEEIGCVMFGHCGDCDDECPPCCMALCNCINCLLPEQGREKKHRKTTHESKLKRYGTDSKNQAYKPAGGNVAIFSEKVDLKTVGARTDSSRPKTAMSPRPGSVSSDRSPISPKPPTPNTRQVQSKIGSLNNVKHKPGGGDVTVLSTKTDFSTVRSKVGSKDKADHKPKGGDKKIEVQKLSWKAESKVGSLKNATHSPGGGNVKVPNQRLSWSAQSRVGSLDNARHTPGGGKVKILDQKLDIKAQSKVGSTANLKHKPGGGDKKIETQKIEIKAKSKVGSLDKVKHQPGGGDVQVFNEPVKWVTESKVQSLANVKHKSGGGDVQVYNEPVKWATESKVQSLANVKHKPGGGDIQVIDQKLEWTATPRIGSLDNVKHVPGGGKIEVIDQKVEWTATPRIGSLDNVKHVPGGGKIEILDEKVDFSEKVSSKVGSMDKIKHQPGGGDKKIETQKLSFKETAKSRTNTGVGAEKEKSRSTSRTESISSSQDGSIQE